ncbi:MAG: hypothetical protein JO154_01660 [Chitinophaga sp.]|uniref:hypothetical protein n=1 Tax=Chitinophaga sp. TaxID=1869181 RepID=UPI0025B995B5|nr:hypothetical protein [Chitinophaga sp.]MBV8251285.1 hypothetical protein [Chitinophaga sp.]
MEMNRLQMESNYCAPAPSLHPNKEYHPLMNKDSLLNQYPDWKPHTVLTANATGTLEMIAQLRQMRRDTGLAATARRAILRSDIQQRLMIAGTEIAGLAAQLDCEGERADQLGRYLDDINDTRDNRLTVASIAAGAITTILTIKLNDERAQNFAAVTGGAISTGLVLMTINPAGKKIRLRLDKNMLSPLWYESDSSHYYSPFIWYMLTEPMFSNTGKHSLAASIRGRWQEYDMGTELSKKEEQKFFGNGGVYTADDLHTRAAMLNELQSSIRSLNQDLQDLMQFLEEIPIQGTY